MLNTILGAVLPTVVTFLLGFAPRRHEFEVKDALILNRMVLLYAVPMALFAGTVTTTRSELGQDIPLAIALCIAIVGLYGLVFVLSRFAFRLPMGVSALVALAASAPAVAFIGPIMTQLEALAKHAARASFAALGAGPIRSLTFGSRQSMLIGGRN